MGPVWLVTGELLKRAGGTPAYREFVESLITRGLPVERFDTMKARLVLGSTTFQEKARKWIGRVTGEQPDRKFAQRRAPMAAIIACVERVKGEKWEGFRDRHGDDGRNLALFVARKRSGLTLREIGTAAGGLE